MSGPRASGPAAVPWPATFEELLCEHLPDGAGEEPLRADDGLFDLGMDSFGMVDLLMALEARFAVSFPDGELTAETFATVGALWAVLGPLLGAAADEDAAG